MANFHRELKQSLFFVFILQQKMNFDFFLNQKQISLRLMVQLHPLYPKLTTRCQKIEKKLRAQFWKLICVPDVSKHVLMVYFKLMRKKSRFWIFTSSNSSCPCENWPLQYAKYGNSRTLVVFSWTVTSLYQTFTVQQMSKRW